MTFDKRCLVKHKFHSDPCKCVLRRHTIELLIIIIKQLSFKRHHDSCGQFMYETETKIHDTQTLYSHWKLFTRHILLHDCYDYFLWNIYQRLRVIITWKCVYFTYRKSTKQWTCLIHNSYWLNNMSMYKNTQNETDTWMKNWLDESLEHIYNKIIHTVFWLWKGVDSNQLLILFFLRLCNKTIKGKPVYIWMVFQ